MERNFQFMIINDGNIPALPVTILSIFLAFLAKTRTLEHKIKVSKDGKRIIKTEAKQQQRRDKYPIKKHI